MTAAPIDQVKPPQIWLMVVSDAAWADAAMAQLNAYTQEHPDGFVAWRWHHGVLRVVLAQHVGNLLDEWFGPAQARPPGAPHIWAALSAAQWYGSTRNCKALLEEALQDISIDEIPSQPSSIQHEVLSMWERPDATDELRWLNGGRMLPVPQAWLSLGAFLAQTDQQQQVMQQEGRACFERWARAFLEENENDELQRTFGPFKADDGTEDEEETNLGELQAADHSTPQSDSSNVVPLGPRRIQRFGVPVPMKLAAAASASGAQQDLLLHAAEQRHGSGRFKLEVWLHQGPVSLGTVPLEVRVIWPAGEPMPAPPIQLQVHLPRSKPWLLHALKPNATGTWHFPVPANLLPTAAPPPGVALVKWLKTWLTQTTNPLTGSRLQGAYFALRGHQADHAR